MARIRFTLGTRYKFKGEVFIIRQILLGGMFVVENQSFGGLFNISEDDLVAAWASNDLIFAVPTSLARPAPNDPLGTEYTYQDFQNLPERQQAEAWRRYQILLPLLKKPSQERTHSFIETYVNELRAANIAEDPTPDQSTTGRRTQVPLGEALSRTSIRRWLAAFIESGYDIRSLVPDLDGRARKGEVRLDLEVDTIVQKVLAECASKPMKRTVNDIYLLVVNRIAEENRTRADGDKLATPGDTTIYRRIKTSKPEVLNRRKGRIETQADAPVADGPRPTRILERVEIDHTRLDLFVVDEQDRLLIGRPTLTFALDGLSGFPCGMNIGFEPPSYRTAASCLSHSILPKYGVKEQFETKHDWPVYGLMETLVVDRAKEFIGADLRDACGLLGIILEILPVKTPWFKASIERFFRTNNTGLIHGLPGTSFSNVLERGEYDALQYACISLTAFRKILHIFLLDIYAQRWHEGKGVIPAKCWEENIQMGFSPVLNRSAEEIRILLMRTDTRVIQRAGIEFEWLFYRSPDLMRLRSQLPKSTEIRFKYDPADISAIYVTDPISGQRLRVPAADQTYTHGLSLWKHRIINRYVQAEKGEVDIEALAAAKAKIQRIVEDEYILTRKNKTRTTAARFLNVGISDASTPELLPVSTIRELEQPGSATQESLVAKSRSKAKDRADKSDTTQLVPPMLSSPTNRLDELDLTGWGGDYSLPKTPGDFNV